MKSPHLVSLLQLEELSPLMTAPAVRTTKIQVTLQTITVHLLTALEQEIRRHNMCIRVHGNSS